MQEVALQSFVSEKCYLKAWLRAALLCAVTVPQEIVFLAAVNHPGLVAAHVHTVAKHRYMAYCMWNGLISQVVLVHRNVDVRGICSASSPWQWGPSHARWGVSSVPSCSRRTQTGNRLSLHFGWLNVFVLYQFEISAVINEQKAHSFIHLVAHNRVNTLWLPSWWFSVKYPLNLIYVNFVSLLMNPVHFPLLKICSSFLTAPAIIGSNVVCFSVLVSFLYQNVVRRTNKSMANKPWP